MHTPYHKNFGPENFGLKDQNFQQKYWSARPFFRKFWSPSEHFGPIDGEKLVREAKYA